MIPRTALAHPMGNFSINHYTRIIAGAREVELDYIIDMAEIPTFQEMKERGLITKGGDPGLAPYLARQAESLQSGLTLEDDGQPLMLECVSRQAIFPPGAGGLPTMKMGFVYRATLPHTIGAAPVALQYRDNNFAGRAGWKEIVAVNGNSVTLTAQFRSIARPQLGTDQLPDRYAAQSAADARSRRDFQGRAARHLSRATGPPRTRPVQGGLPRRALQRRRA